MKLYIKYMVNLRCKMLVKDEIIKFGLHYISVDLGMVEFMEEMNAEQHQLLKLNLIKSGLHLLDDKKSILIDLQPTNVSHVQPYRAYRPHKSV